MISDYTPRAQPVIGRAREGAARDLLGGVRPGTYENCPGAPQAQEKRRIKQGCELIAPPISASAANRPELKRTFTLP